MRLYYNAWELGMTAMRSLVKEGVSVNEGMDYFQMEREIAAYREKMMAEQLAEMAADEAEDMDSDE